MDSKHSHYDPLELPKGKSDFVGPEVYTGWSRKLKNFLCKIIHRKLGSLAKAPED